MRKKICLWSYGSRYHIGLKLRNGKIRPGHPLSLCLFYMALYQIIWLVLAVWLCNETKSSLEEITVSWHRMDVAFIFLFIFIFYSWFIAPAVWTFRERSHWEIHLWSFTMCKCLSVEIIPLCWTDLTGIFFLFQSVFLMMLIKKTRSFWKLRKGWMREREARLSLPQPKKRPAHTQATHNCLFVPD